MKQFFKTIWHGLCVISMALTSVTSVLLSVILLFYKLHETTGISAVGIFILSLGLLALGILYLWVMGDIYLDAIKKNEEDDYAA